MATAVKATPLDPGYQRVQVEDDQGGLTLYERDGKAPNNLEYHLLIDNWYPGVVILFWNADGTRVLREEGVGLPDNIIASQYNSGFWYYRKV